MLNHHAPDRFWPGWLRVRVPGNPVVERGELIGLYRKMNRRGVNSRPTPSLFFCAAYCFRHHLFVQEKASWGKARFVSGGL
jgi:hypothetical protein